MVGSGENPENRSIAAGDAPAQRQSAPLLASVMDLTVSEGILPAE